METKDIKSRGLKKLVSSIIAVAFLLSGTIVPSGNVYANLVPLEEDPTVQTHVYNPGAEVATEADAAMNQVVEDLAGYGDGSYYGESGEPEEGEESEDEYTPPYEEGGEETEETEEEYGEEIPDEALEAAIEAVERAYEELEAAGNALGAAESARDSAMEEYEKAVKRLAEANAEVPKAEQKLAEAETAYQLAKSAMEQMQVARDAAEAVYEELKEKADMAQEEERCKLRELEQAKFYLDITRGEGEEDLGDLENEVQLKQAEWEAAQLAARIATAIAMGAGEIFAVIESQTREAELVCFEARGARDCAKMGLDFARTEVSIADIQKDTAAFAWHNADMDVARARPPYEAALAAWEAAKAALDALENPEE